MEGPVLKRTVAVLLLILLSVSWPGTARRAFSGASTPLSSVCKRKTFTMGLVMLHHFHVVPLHHLEEVRRELRHVRHSWEAGHVLLKARWVSRITLVKVLQMASAFLLCRLLSAEVLTIARTLQELGISLVFELLVDDDVVGYVVDVVGSIRSFDVPLLVIGADVASSVALVWRLLPVSVQ